MKNKYKTTGETTCIYVNRPDNTILEVIIDTADIELVNSFHNTWGATKSKNDRYIIKGTYREEKVKKNISLAKYIIGESFSAPIRFLNGDTLDHRRQNLIQGHDIQIPKGNKYEIKGCIVDVQLNRKGKSPLITKIDVDDLEKVITKGTWYAEWHKDIKNYLVNNISYTIVNGKKKRRKISLHLFIKNIDDSSPVKHMDGDTLNNCKSNLRVYSKELINDIEIIDDTTVAIILKDKQGKIKGKTLIDRADIEKVENNGYTWFYYKGNGGPYAVANSSNGRVYLHRLIMNTPENMVTDHINHDTLDNRKVNLNNATISQNQQNRKGSRKGSKSGIRGVSWDENNQDWLVIVKGIYFGRFKNIDDAEKLAQEKYNELMPYIREIK